ncbi:hypothetical protein [Mycolicibacterium sp. P9-64]|uniref:hypothetical protein n=1 Tax=Mycolicibacterium sp. P9-64 TaxID=2024612 RepID=UPI0011EFB258|nr:hypothetical protein [Mycolicibacterium sp. P9-64]
MPVRHVPERESATTHHDALDEAITNAFTAVEPLIRIVARWPHVVAPAYVVVVDRPGHPLRDLVISDLPRDRWPAPFDELARGKAALTARTGMPSRRVLQDRLDLLEPGDPCWFGSVIDTAHGLVVAASGGPEDVDEMISRAVLDLIRIPAVLRAREEALRRGPHKLTFQLP